MNLPLPKRPERNFAFYQPVVPRFGKRPVAIDTFAEEIPLPHYPFPIPTSEDYAEAVAARQWLRETEEWNNTRFDDPSEDTEAQLKLRQQLEDDPYSIALETDFLKSAERRQKINQVVNVFYYAANYVSQCFQYVADWIRMSQNNYLEANHQKKFLAWWEAKRKRL